jgi:hypothetical protein
VTESTSIFDRSNGIAWIGSTPPLPVLKKRTAPLGPFCCGWPKGGRDCTQATNCRTVTTATGQERSLKSAATASRKRPLLVCPIPLAWVRFPSPAPSGFGYLKGPSGHFVISGRAVPTCVYASVGPAMVRWPSKSSTATEVNETVASAAPDADVSVGDKARCYVDDLSALHDKTDAAKRPDVVQWIALDSDNVRRHSGANGAGRAAQTQRFRSK